ncbi:hypothetical protein BLS_001986 [Venturia inaequalis]|uniref:Zn(2)-C6 fungal-type domain-containing protein n=1 Tax=Venturia inaequalis TaxID=5025 RepID=A0A8H3VJE9_VENIN|nr:hypothetical protein BLS_001986 [Venturia inaequalis]KAE9990239.1 hypothetical protein EG327_001666 [Venturia inaequalis]RDI79258.1 hypothetical protein Vi05172_g10725 [Venturia inaequalis]
MSTSQPTTEKKERSRSKAACQFCRTRKLKCDNLEPECSACRSRSIECVYVQRVAAPRPSNAAIQALQAENRRLRRLLEAHRIDVNEGGLSPDDGSSQMASPIDARVAAMGPQREEHMRDVDPFVHNQGEARRQSMVPFDPQLDSGTDPASALADSYANQPPMFEQAGEQYAIPSELDPSTRDMLRHQLVAASARQRQTEMLPENNKLNDYDGYDPNLVHHLLNIHWNRQHHNLLLIYRPLFMRDWGTGGPYFSKLLLNAILFAAAKFSPRTDIRKDPNWAGSSGYQFRERFTTLLGEAMGESRITTIQALITLASSLFAIETTAKSTAWLYSGIAFRMITDLGLHLDGVELLKRNKISPEELECRRRVFWGAFSFDKIHSMYFGRPVTLQETQMRVPIEFLDDYEELEQWTPLEQLNNAVSADYPRPAHPGGPSYSVMTFTAMCKVSVVLGRILNDIYSETAYNHGTSLTQAQTQLFAQNQKVLDDSLESCAMQFPLEIRFEPWVTGEPLSLQRTPTPTVLSLHCLYHISMILLHRPYLTRGHLYDEHLAEASLQKCTSAAIRLAQIARVYCHAFTVRRTPYFIAYSAYVAITILIRVSAHLPQGSSAQKSLHFCLGILSDSEKTNQGVKRASFVVSKLLFAVARGGPNPFPDSENHRREPWGEVIDDRIELSREAMSMIISTFSTTSPDAAAEQSQLEVHPQDPGINGHPSFHQAQAQLQLASGDQQQPPRSFNDMDQGTAAQLLASLRTNTPVISSAPSPKMNPYSALDSVQAFPDTIFGLHNDESFQSWPDFNEHLETLLYGGNLMGGMGSEAGGGS